MLHTTAIKRGRPNGSIQITSDKQIKNAFNAFKSELGLNNQGRKTFEQKTQMKVIIGKLKCLSKMKKFKLYLYTSRELEFFQLYSCIRTTIT